MAKVIRLGKPGKKKKNSSTTEGESFFQDVFEVVRLIPRGKVTSYGAIAKYLGSAGSSRMVGWAMNSSHAQFPPVPAHRVLNRNGVLTGKHFFGPDNEMAEMLKEEGIKVVDDTVQNLESCFWDPVTEL